MFSPQERNGNYVMDMLSSAMVVIVLQYISASNKHVVHLKLTQCYMLIISQ